MCVKAGGQGARITPSIPIPGSKLDSAKRNRTATASQSPHMYQNMTVMAVEVSWNHRSELEDWVLCLCFLTSESSSTTKTSIGQP